MDNPKLELLKYRAIPELATALRSRRDVIVDRLNEAIKELLPAADELTLVQLRDQLPHTLDELAAALESTEPTATRQFLSDSFEHGVCRFHQNFNLREVMIEYSLFRTILIEEVALAVDRPLSVEEIMTLNVGIDVSARRAVTAFVSRVNQQLAGTNEAQSKYLSFLSHDLRGSLNGILLMVEVLKRELAGHEKFAESLDDLDLMRRSVMDTVSTMDRFLHAERFRKGKFEVRLATIDVPVLMKELASQVAHSAQAKGVVIHTDTCDVVQVNSDRELLTIILQNLLGNSVKYSRHGTINLVAEQCGDGATRLWVSDQGPGIPREKLDALFSPFVRGETYGQSGTGLGLSIARQAAHLLKAKLWAESTPGQGSKFILELPGAGANA